MTAARHRPIVLLVDDSEIVCESVKHTLSEVGLDVIALNSPFGFIKTIRESHPALILIDVGLGALNGSKLVQLGRQNAPRGCPILLYSGRDVVALQQDVATSGANGYLSKSTTGVAFTTAVLKWVASRDRS
jgi:DNA-binding NarL/FixJ family response regulator